MERKWKDKWFLPLLFMMAAVCVAPVGFLLAGSLMDQQELGVYLGAVMGSREGYASWRMLPLFPTLRNFVEVLLDLPAFFVMFWNTVKLTVGTLAGQLLFAVPAAWGLARFRFPMKHTIYTLYVVLMLMPFQVRMLSDYLVLDRLALLNRHAGILLTGIFSTFPVFILYRFFENIPQAVLEAAKIDGAGTVEIFFRIGLPIGRGGVVSVLVLGFLEYWNMIEQPLAFLKDRSLWPLALFLPQIELSRAGVAFASSIVALVPSVLVFLLGQEDLEQGIAAAAVKE